MFQKKRNLKILETRLQLTVSLAQPLTQMIEFLMSISKQLESRRYHEAAGSIIRIFELCDLLEKAAKMHLSLEVYRIFETDAKLSCTREEVEKKRDDVFNWLGEVKGLTSKLQDKLRAREINPYEIANDFDVLLKKICYDMRFTDFMNTLIFLASEFEVYRVSETRGIPVYLFNTLKLHPIIMKASRELFNDGHYSSAILESYKSLNNYIKAKTKQKDLDGVKLMSQVFSFKYNPETHRLEKSPLLQLNKMSDQSDRDEQEGFMHIFMGSMQGIRNPKAHEVIEQKDPYRTLEYLTLASLLVKRVDEAELNC